MIFGPLRLPLPVTTTATNLFRGHCQFSAQRRKSAREMKRNHHQTTLFQCFSKRAMEPTAASGDAAASAEDVSLDNMEDPDATITPTGK